MAQRQIGPYHMLPRTVIRPFHRVQSACVQTRRFTPFPPHCGTCAMKACSIRSSVVSQSFARGTYGGYVHRLTRMKNGCQNKSLTEGRLVVSAYHFMYMRRDVRQLQVGSVLQVFGYAAYGSF